MESFDYVRSYHSFEHMSNPRETLAEIHRILKPNGKLMIGVPNTAGLPARVFGETWYYLGAPLHVYGYNPKNLKRMVESNGFRVDSVRFNSNFRGIVGSVQFRTGRNSSGARQLLSNPLLKLSGQVAARGLDLVRAGDCMELFARTAPEDRK